MKKTLHTVVQSYNLFLIKFSSVFLKKKTREALGGKGKEGQKKNLNGNPNF